MAPSSEQLQPEPAGPALAWFAPAPAANRPGWLAADLLEVTGDPRVLERGGRWAVQIDYEGAVHAARFGVWQPDPDPGQLAELAGRWQGPAPSQWQSSLTEAAYRRAVDAVRTQIARGEVYQANITRIMSGALPDPDRRDVLALGLRLVAGNPAPHAGVLRVPGVEVACASPELYLSRAGQRIGSRPIKGTGVRDSDLLDKDFAENVMIVDLVRNDLAQICVTGSISVPELCVVEAHPGLVHLVSEVAGELRAGVTWADILASTFPAGSITGAPKIAACRIIRGLEPRPRGPYCGAFGWIDADTGRAELAVAIRTFWLERAEGGTRVAFGTGAGITWGSDPAREWEETCLKAARLVALAAS